jgi:transcriptional regulator with XRE-family HTH domain
MKSKEGLLKRLQRRAYRRAFVAANIGVQIAAQLYALRISRKLSQEKLAKEIDMNQARISLMEKPEYQNYNIRTLKRFAEFYDIALDVRFVSIKDHVNRIINQPPQDMAVPAFGEEDTVADTVNPDDVQRSFEPRSTQPNKPQAEEPQDSGLKKVAEQFFLLTARPSLERLAWN